MLVRKIFLLAVTAVIMPFSTLAGINITDYKYGTELVSRSKTVLNAGMIRLAEEELLEAVRNFPGNPAMDRAVLLQAEIDMIPGNYKIAEADLTEFIEKRKNSPLVPHAALLRSYIALDQKDYKKAVRYFEFTVKSSEENIDKRDDTSYASIAAAGLYWQGISSYQLGNYQSAEPVLDKCRKDYRDMQYSDDAIFALGRIEEIRRDYDKAARWFQSIRTDYPYSNSAVASMIREANDRLLLRDPSTSIVILKNAEIALNRINSKDSIGKLYQEQTYLKNPLHDITYLRGESYNYLGNFRPALTIFESYLQTFVDSDIEPYVHLGAGWALLHLGENEKALEHYNAVIFDEDADSRSRPKAMAQLYRTVALSRSGQKEEARKELAALSVQPTYPYLGSVLLELGQIYYEEKDYIQAKNTLERADREAIDPAVSTRIQLLLGATYLAIGNWEKAAAEYNEAEKLALKSDKIIMPQRDWYISEARLKRGMALVESHRSAEAIPVLQSFIGSTGQQDPRHDEGLFWLAEAYFRTELFKNAIETYNSLMGMHPRSTRREETLYGLGWSHFLLRNFSRSSETFDKMIEEYPDSRFSVEVLSRQADGYYVTKNYSKAAESYSRAAQLAPKTDEGQYALFQKADALYRLGSYDRSIVSLMNFVKQYPRSPFAPNAHYLMGWIRFEQGKYSEAIDNFNFLIRAYSQSESNLVPRAHYAIGDCYYNQGNYQSAIMAYKTVIESYPSSELAPEAMRSMQQCLMLLGREEEAMQMADKFIETNPGSPFAPDFKFKKADMFYSGRRYKDAISEYESFMKKYPSSEKNADALYWMEKSYISLNEPEKAAEVFQKLKTKFPKDELVPLGLLELALMHKELNQIDAADSLFLLLQNQYTTSQYAAQGGFERARIKYSMGDTAAAMKIYRNVADNYAGLEYADQSRWKIAMHLRSKGLNDSARAEFEILSKRETNPEIAAEAQYRVGELYFRDEQYERAIDEFLEFRDKFSYFSEWYALTLLNLGESYEKTDNYEKARDVYESLLALRPDDDFGKTAKRRLKRLPKN